MQSTFTSRRSGSTTATMGPLARSRPSGNDANGPPGRQGRVVSKTVPMAMALIWAFALERVTGIEPALSAWELYGAACVSPGDSATCRGS
jgi:hypothetical protein